MKLSKGGFRLSKNGSIIWSVEKEAIQKDTYCGQSIKEEGIYHFFERQQGSKFIYSVSNIS